MNAFIIMSTPKSVNIFTLAIAMYHPTHLLPTLCCLEVIDKFKKINKLYSQQIIGYLVNARLSDHRFIHTLDHPGWNNF